MIIETFLKEVPGKGLGLFSAVNVKKDEIVWKYETNLTKRFLPSEVDRMDKMTKDFINKYAYIFPWDSSIIELDLDNTRFINHSNDPNTTFPRGEIGFAIKDIKAGEEITCDYTKFDAKPLDFLDDGGGI